MAFPLISCCMHWDCMAMWPHRMLLGTPNNYWVSYLGLVRDHPKAGMGEKRQALKKCILLLALSPSPLLLGSQSCQFSANRCHRHLWKDCGEPELMQSLLLWLWSPMFSSNKITSTLDAFYCNLTSTCIQTAQYSGSKPTTRRRAANGHAVQVTVGLLWVHFVLRVILIPLNRICG